MPDLAVSRCRAISCRRPIGRASGARRRTGGCENQIVTRDIANALDRVQVGVWFSAEEVIGLREGARAATGMLHFAGAEVHGLNLPLYIRTVLGFHVRWHSKPGGDTRRTKGTTPGSGCSASGWTQIDTFRKWPQRGVNPPCALPLLKGVICWPAAPQRLGQPVRETLPA